MIVLVSLVVNPRELHDFSHSPSLHHHSFSSMVFELLPLQLCTYAQFVDNMLCMRRTIEQLQVKWQRA